MLSNTTIVCYEKTIALLRKSIVFKDQIIALLEAQNDRLKRSLNKFIYRESIVRPKMRVVWRNELFT